MPGQLIQEMLPGTVGGDRHRVAEQHGASIGGEVRLPVKGFGQPRRLGAHCAPVIAAIGVELQMREMGPPALEHIHGFQRRRHVPGHAQVVAVQVKRMRQLQLVNHRRQAADDVRRRDTLVAFHRLEQGAGVLSPLPRGDAAGIDRLHAVRLGRPDHPGDDVPGPLLLARFEQIEHELVVGHEHERGLVDNRNVVQFFVRVSGRQDRHRRFVHRRPAHAGVEVAGGKRGGRHAAQAGAAAGTMQKLAGGALIFGNQAAGEIQGATGDVRVDIDPAGKHEHAARINNLVARLGRMIVNDAAAGDADVLDRAVDAVGGIVDLAVCDSDHCAWNVV